MKPTKEAARNAIASVEAEAKLARSHDIGEEGAKRLQAAALLLRRFLWSVLCVILALYSSTYCSQAPKPAGGGDLVGHPGVSAPFVERTLARMALVSPTPGRQAREGHPTFPRVGERRSLVAPPPPPWDCQAYARTLIPWTGPTPDPRFFAANEALLPDLPEFAARRKAACATLERTR